MILGITIAFTIDKMAENRKESREMKAAMESIMDDLRRDIRVFEKTQIPTNQERVDQLNYLLNEMKSESANRDTMSVLVRQALGSMNSVVTSATYESLMAAGKLEDIPNVKVRRSIISYYQGNIGQYLYLSQSNSAFLKELSDHVSTVSDAFFTGDFGNPALLEDQVFRNMLARWRNTIDFKVSEYERLVRESKSLLALMEKEFN